MKSARKDVPYSPQLRYHGSRLKPLKFVTLYIELYRQYYYVFIYFSSLYSSFVCLTLMFLWRCIYIELHLSIFLSIWFPLSCAFVFLHRGTIQQNNRHCQQFWFYEQFRDFFPFFDNITMFLYISHHFIPPLFNLLWCFPFCLIMPFSNSLDFTLTFLL